MRSADHQGLSDAQKKTPSQRVSDGDDQKRPQGAYDHDYEAEHFDKVGFWWYLFCAGAVAAVLAEVTDWWGEPIIAWLIQVIHWLT
jgi:hypothetical protein